MASDENCILVLPSENPIDDFLWSNRVLGKAIAAFEEWGRTKIEIGSWWSYCRVNGSSSISARIRGRGPLAHFDVSVWEAAVGIQVSRHECGRVMASVGVDAFAFEGGRRVTPAGREMYIYGRMGEDASAGVWESTEMMSEFSEWDHVRNVGDVFLYSSLTAGFVRGRLQISIHGYESHVSGGPRITMAKGGVPRENVAIDIVDGVEEIDVSGVAIDESLGAASNRCPGSLVLVFEIAFHSRVVLVFLRSGPKGDEGGRGNVVHGSRCREHRVPLGRACRRFGRRAMGKQTRRVS